MDNIPKNGDEIGLNAAIKISKPMTVIGDHIPSDEEGKKKIRIGWLIQLYNPVYLNLIYFSNLSTYYFQYIWSFSSANKSTAIIGGITIIKDANINFIIFLFSNSL